MASSIKTTAFSLAKGTELRSDDSYEVKIVNGECIAVVCDGVGSAIGGGEASLKAVSHIVKSFKNRPISWAIDKSILSFIETINTLLYNTSIAKYERAEMLTTLAMVVVIGDRLYGANIGDSSILICRDNKLNKLSNDHNMKEKEFTHVLTKALGLEKEVEPYFFENFVQPNDKILICSDGLTNILDSDEILKNISFGANFLVKLASEKVNHILPDDTTAIVLEINEIDEIIKLKQQNLTIPKTLQKDNLIDGYLLQKSLSENDRTWLCEKDHKEVILKFPLYNEDDQERLTDCFVKEAWNARRLKAGFLPKAYIPVNRTYRYYLMEKIDGITLKEHISKRKLGIEDAIKLGQTLLKMGQYLMKYDLVHGDIKPENIIVSQRNGKMNFTIVDFGSITEIFSIDSKAGTPSYLAPERFIGSGINEGSEIFSIGVVLYEALSGKFPYGEIEPFQNPTFFQAKRVKSRNNNISSWLDSVISRSISVDENKRYKNYSHMLYELENSDKVETYYGTDTPLLEMIPPKVAQYGFVLMMMINIILLFKIFQ